MKKNILQLILLSVFLALFIPIHTSVFAISAADNEGICTPDSENASECIDVSPPTSPDVTLPKKEKRTPAALMKNKKTHTVIPEEKKTDKGFTVYFFWGKGCPHCAEEKIFLADMKKIRPSMEIKEYEVWYSSENAALLTRMAEAYKIKSSGVPVTFIGDRAFIGFSKQSKEEIEESLRRCISDDCIDPFLVVSGKLSLEERKGYPEIKDKTEDLECTQKSRVVYIPWIGNLDASELSLPVITFVIAGLDSFNPCAFFVLFSLLGLLIHAQSRKKMLLTGSVFVFFSGFIYFVFMAAWLNLFLFMGQVQIITKIAGAVAVAIAAINIKDFFIFKKGVSLTIPDSAKPKLFDRMRRLMKTTSLLSILIGTTVLAIAANSYELLCTAGFPMVFTRILTLNKLPTSSYYVYLILYNFIYVIPLAVIVIIFTVTLGKRQLTEWQGRLLKLVSGIMMLGLGGVLLFDPTILSNAFISFILIAGALVVAVAIAFITRKLGY